jgi:PilZ domain
MDNRRRFSRFPFECPISFFGDGIFGSGEVYNLSLGGCAVDSHCPVQAGLTVRVLVYVAGRVDPMPVPVATIRWAVQDKFGIEFVTIPSTAHEKLYDVMRRLEAAT